MARSHTIRPRRRSRSRDNTDYLLLWSLILFAVVVIALMVPSVPAKWDAIIDGLAELYASTRLAHGN